MNNNYKRLIESKELINNTIECSHVIIGELDEQDNKIDKINTMMTNISESTTRANQKINNMTTIHKKEQYIKVFIVILTILIIIMLIFLIIFLNKK